MPDWLGLALEIIFTSFMMVIVAAACMSFFMGK